MHISQSKVNSSRTFLHLRCRRTWFIDSIAPWCEDKRARLLLFMHDGPEVVTLMYGTTKYILLL